MVATPKHGAEKTLVAARRSRGGMRSPNHGDGDDDEASAAYSFERAPKGDQLHHILREAAEARSRRETPRSPLAARILRP